jgi:hypothetical protein
MRKRLLIGLVVALSMSLVAPAQSEATPHRSHLQATRQTWERAVTDYYLGSGANPLFSGTCGRVVHGVFLLVAATQPGEHRRCAVPRGVPLLAVPAAVLEWRGAAMETPAQLRADLVATLPTLTDIHASLDRRPLHTTLVRGRPHRLRLHPGNLIQAVDPGVTGTSTLVLSAAYLAWVPPLRCGHHVVRLSDTIDGTVTDITFHVTAR